MFYIRVTNIFTVPVSFALQKGESKMKDKAGFETRTKTQTKGEHVKNVNGNGIDKDGPFAYVETVNDDKDEDENRLLLDEGAVWHEWFKQNCYYKSPATNVKNDMCPLSYQNMDNRTLWYNWYSLHHLTHRSNSTFTPSFPEFTDHATLMRKNHKADTTGSSILTSQIVSGVETNIYSDKHQKFFASMELDEGPFYVHPFSQPDYKVSKGREDGRKEGRKDMLHCIHVLEFCFAEPINNYYPIQYNNQPCYYHRCSRSLLHDTHSVFLHYLWKRFNAESLF